MIDERERFAKKSIRDVEIPDFDATKGLMAGTFATGKDDALRSGMRKDARKKGEAKMLPRLLSACYVLSRSFRPFFSSSFRSRESLLVPSTSGVPRINAVNPSV